MWVRKMLIKNPDRDAQLLQADEEVIALMHEAGFLTMDEALNRLTPQEIDECVKLIEEGAKRLGDKSNNKRRRYK